MCSNESRNSFYISSEKPIKGFLKKQQQQIVVSKITQHQSPRKQMDSFQFNLNNKPCACEWANLVSLSFSIFDLGENIKREID